MTSDPIAQLEFLFANANFHSALYALSLLCVYQFPLQNVISSVYIQHCTDIEKLEIIEITKM